VRTEISLTPGGPLAPISPQKSSIIGYNPDPTPVEAGSGRQRQHYDHFHEEYREYYDAESVRYREEFIYKDLLAGLDLDGCDVADLACGGAAVTSMAVHRRFPRARLMGFDISTKACIEYEGSTGWPAMPVDLTQPIAIPNRFDCAIIVGGLHHCACSLPQTLTTIRSLLKPGGWLLMMEPNDDYIFGSVRRLWYRLDGWFDAQTEQALRHDELLRLAQPHFALKDVCFRGGIGYFLILNSVIFRMPQFVKRMLAGPLMVIERAHNTLPSRRLLAYFLARWQAI
jgi:SAM-dependent methyltransferase